MEKSNGGKVIWIINHYASHLKQRHLELGKVFARNGYKTIVITSTFEHGSHKYLFSEEYTVEQRVENLFFIYLKSSPAYQSSGIERILNMFDFSYLVTKFQRKIAKEFGKPQYVIGSSAHPLVWENAYRIAKKYKARFIAEFRDIWPLSMVEIQGMSPKHPAVLFFNIIEKRAYRRADAIVGTMPYVYKYVCEDLGFPGEKCHWMPNGICVADIEYNKPIPADLNNFLSQHWCCVYTGSIVKSEHIDLMLRAMEELKDEDIYLALIGDGNLKIQIQEFIIKHNLIHVKMFSKVDKNLIPSVLQKASCCLAACHDRPIYRFGLSTNKLNDYLVSGKPVLFGCSFQNVIHETENLVINGNDEKAYAEAILRVKNMSKEEIERIGESGKRVVKTVYDYSVIGKKYLMMLNTL